MRIGVKAKPSAKENKVIEFSNTVFEVRVTEPPIQGRANRAIISLLADHFSIPQNKIRIISGYTSRFKIIDIS